MGANYLSIQFRDADDARIAAALKSELAQYNMSAFVCKALDGWTTVFPTIEILDVDAFASIAKASGVKHVLLISLFDSDVFCYWYARDGAIVDYFNSAPDYFGEASDEDMEAKGDPAQFAGLLDHPSIGKLKTLVSARMIDGEAVGGEVPDFEDDRHQEFLDILGIRTPAGHFEEFNPESEFGEPLDSSHMIRI